MLPRLAAAVWSTTVRIRSCPRPVIPNSTTAKGTKVSRATSLVMSMELKKVRPISTRPRARALPARRQTRRARASRAPAFRSPAEITIRA